MVNLDRVQPAMKHLPPNLQPWVVSTAKLILPVWLRQRCGITEIEERNIERFIQINQQFQAGKVRYLLAFRHPTIDDQFALFHLFAKATSHATKQMGIKLERPIHSYYVYDRGIPLWAGNLATWFYPRTGGISINRGKLDRQALRTLRQTMVDGDFPLAISPEGDANNHNERVNRLEPGAAQIGFWTVEELAKADRQEQVMILPVGLQYEYLGNPWPNIDRFLMDLECECGVDKAPLRSPTMTERYQRLRDFGNYLIDYTGDFYQRFYRDHMPEPKPDSEHSETIGDRLEQLLDTILRIAESHFKIKPNGSFIERCRRLEAAGWEQIFRNDIPDPKSRAPLEQGLADRLAKEANSSLSHMRIAEGLAAITGDYVVNHLSASRFVDILQLIWRGIRSAKGKSFGRAPYLGKRKCTISIGEPLVVNDYYREYSSSRAGAKTAIADLTNNLQTAMEHLIFPSCLA
ncbi:phospholipid/glycerol acyltransferase [Thalassoporum mexicanum PCC 7367]|uniref:phospholipid/glycerol acyltransferase n=1 Tax=Thalassoporum mexicanum TaxID=3457544 RepID=UPI00029FACF1|nr:phospholipid/glycerol acyltransferase [Pseudanabaena sp. PCC 7367]AFY69984.1 phospholipid/glycerol acyltransferase [Pseudanabaena sp. PCC 7367]